jgi:asparagine synthase (glutamine-hydrolysing)
MCALLIHRGPDDEGFYTSERAAMGMRRLAIIDVAAGRQPLRNEDGSVWTVCNGEIYNYLELRAGLESRGHRFLTSSDCECLVHLYEEHGADFVEHLRGMFAFAIWDVRTQTMIVGRDRLGIKPLYYHVGHGTMAFASELKCLLAIPGIDPGINQQALSEFFTFAYVPGPGTIYEGLLEVPPGHIGIWRVGTFRLQRYWQLNSVTDEERPAEFFAEGLLHHLKDAIRLHLLSEVPLGAFLSGGIDSSAIVALMSEVSDRPAKTFTVGFESEEPRFDERPAARTLAHALGTDHRECLLNAQLADVLPRIVEAFDEPFADSSAIPNYLICQAARQHVTVALSGLGGDELFAGYERYRGTLLAAQYGRVPRPLRRAVLDPAISMVSKAWMGGAWRDRAQRFIGGADLGLAERYQQYVSAYGDSEKAELFSGDVVRQLDHRGLLRTPLAMEKSDSRGGALDRMLSTDMHTYLTDNELRKMDRLSMQHSLEVRVPFLDHKLVEFVSTIPTRYRLRWGQKKYILRRALRGTLPHAVLARRKQGFSVPLGQWLRGPLRDLVHSYLSASAIRDVGLIDHRTVTRILAEHDRGVTNHETKIWVLLSFVLWHERYIQNRPSLIRVGAQAEFDGSDVQVWPLAHGATTLLRGHSV